MLKTLVLVYALGMTALGLNITGTVKEDGTDVAIEGVQVIINTTDTVYTDSTGTFYFTIEEEELKSIELNREGYESQKMVYIEDEKPQVKGLFKKKRDN